MAKRRATRHAFTILSTIAVEIKHQFQPDRVQ